MRKVLGSWSLASQSPGPQTVIFNRTQVQRSFVGKKGFDSSAINLASTGLSHGLKASQTQKAISLPPPPPTPVKHCLLPSNALVGIISMNQEKILSVAV